MDKARGGIGRRTPARVWALALVGLLLLPPAGWVLLRQRYDSWHPCDWLLVDRVALILRRAGIDPDTASVPLKATVAASPEARAVLQLRNTPVECLSTWVAGRVLP